jgi:hypothetical protein
MLDVYGPIVLIYNIFLITYTNVAATLFNF